MQKETLQWSQFKLILYPVAVRFPYQQTDFEKTFHRRDLLYFVEIWSTLAKG